MLGGTAGHPDANYKLPRGSITLLHHTKEVLCFLPHDSKIIEVEQDGALPSHFSSHAINKFPVFGSFGAMCSAFLFFVDSSV